MSQGFLIWTDLHPILVGAGCLALGYVYGRHCRSSSEIQADEPPASDDACCARSQSNTYLEDLERCKCCVSAPVELDTMAVGNGKASNCTRSPYMVQDAAEGFEQAGRSTKRDLGRRNSMDRYAHHMEELDYTDGEAHGVRQHSSSPYFEKSNQMQEEKRLLQAKTPYKKQKGTAVIKESLCSMGKAEMGRGRDEDDAAASVPWSQEVLNKRIDYFNNATSVSETTDSGRSDESRKLRHFKKKFLKVSTSSEGEATYNSISTNSQKSTSNPRGVERSTCGLVPLATPDRVDCSHDNSPNSLHRIFGGGCNAAITGDTSAVPQAVQNFITKGPEAPEIPSIVLKAEIYELLNETDCSKVSFQEIVSLLEERLQTDLQESKAHIATLVREVISISKLLEEEGLTDEVESEQNKATGFHHDLSKVNCSTSSSRLAKFPFLYDCP